MKVKTMQIKGNEYAKVVERVKQFREDCPRGLIETSPEIINDTIVFKARILKDKSDKNSAEATGHAMAKNTGSDKQFEKLETISVGRSLAMLGYMSSGEIASDEEMEEYNNWRTEKIDDNIDRLNQAKSLDDLKKVFMSLGSLMADSRIIEAKDKRKKELNENN